MHDPFPCILASNPTGRMPRSRRGRLREADVECLSALRFRQKADETLALFAEGVAILPGQALEGFDEECRRFPGPLDKTLWSLILRATKGPATPFSPAFVAPTERRGPGQSTDGPVLLVLAGAIMASEDTQEEQE